MKTNEGSKSKAEQEAGRVLSPLCTLQFQSLQEMERAWARAPF